MEEEEEEGEDDGKGKDEKGELRISYTDGQTDGRPCSRIRSVAC